VEAARAVRPQREGDAHHARLPLDLECLAGFERPYRERRDLELGIRPVELRAGLEEPDDVGSGRRQRSGPGRLVLLGHRPLPFLGAEQRVVANILGEPEL
jgi:hypothetical protein